MNAEVQFSSWETFPADVLISGDNVHIWRFDLDEYSDQHNHLFTFLSDDEKRRADQYCFEIHRKHYITGRYILRRLLGKYLGKEPGAIRFSYNKYGKPFVDQCEIGFNISHSQNFAVYAFSAAGEIGIDIEGMNAAFGTLQVAERFFSKIEIQSLNEFPVKERLRAFFNCWTKKESYIKAKGQGLSIPLSSFAVDVSSHPHSTLHFSHLFQEDTVAYNFFTFSPYNNFVATVSVSNRNARLYFFEEKFPKGI